MRSGVAGFLACVMVVISSGAVFGPPSLGALQDVQAGEGGTSARRSDRHASAKPDPSTEDPSAVSRVADNVRPALVFLKAPGGGSGTGFVISRKHRLVATAAHVADLLFKPAGLLAFREGTTLPCAVDRVWYHPRVRRRLDDFLIARSENPNDGEIVGGCFDVAILQLSEHGPELPVELQLAPGAVCDSVSGRMIGVLGYFGAKSRATPTVGHPQLAKYNENAALLPAKSLESDHEELSFKSMIFFDWADLSGGSGGPCFVEDGLVVGVLAGWKSYGKAGVYAAAKAVFLHELIRYQKLDGLLPGSAQVSQPQDYPGQDPLLDRYRAVIQLTRHAAQLRQSGSYARAVRKCNEALSLVPEYGGALLERSKVYFDYAISHWGTLNDEERTNYIVWAGNDAHQCDTKYPDLVWPGLFVQQINIYLAFIRSDLAGFAHVLSELDEITDAETRRPKTHKELAFACNLRAQANDFLGKFASAETDYSESIKLDPFEPQWYSNRAQFWERRDMRDLAKVDRWTARSLRDGLIKPE